MKKKIKTISVNAAISSSARASNLMMPLLIVGVFLIAVQLWLSPANGQSGGLTTQELAATVPSPGDKRYRGPYYRWRDGSRISVVVMTDNQTSSCVDTAIAQIRKHAALVRRDVPALAQMADVLISDRIPAAVNGPVILIGLPTENPYIENALGRFGRERRRNGRLLEIDSSFIAGEGFRNPHAAPARSAVYSFGEMTVLGVASQQIQFAYNWSTNKYGISLFEPELCDSMAWAGPLYDALGTYNLRVLANSLLSPYIAGNLYPTAAGFVRRIFLRALYSLPTDPDVNQLRSTFGRLLAEAASSLPSEISKE